MRLVLPVAVCGLCGACATVPRRPAAAGQRAGSISNRLVRSLRVAQARGWRAVNEVERALQRKPVAEFPGVGALTDRIRLLSGHMPAGRDVPVFGADEVAGHNPNFWRAFYEMEPGEPLMGQLNVGLLLAGGEAARAHDMATLWINFGRMSLAHREELVGLDLYARGLVQAARQSRADKGPRKSPVSSAERARAAQAALEVWPQNPDALMRLVEAVWIDDGKPAQISPDSMTARIAKELRETDPMSPAFGRVPKIGTPDLNRVRMLWLRVSDDANAGDLDLLRQFSVDAQAAGLDDLALCARSLLAAWKAAPGPPDESFVRASLRRLVGASTAESICGEIHHHNRQRVGFGPADRSPLAGHPGPFVHPQLEQQMLVRIAGYSYWIDHGQRHGPALATNYVGRGQAWIGLGRLRQGIADLKHALRLDPNDDHARWSLASALGRAGDFRTADALFAEAAKRTPANVGVAVGWAGDLFMEQRWKEAAAAFERAARMDPTYAFPRLMTGLARRRGGLSAGIDFGALKKARDPWTAALAAYVAGGIDRSALYGRMEPHGNRRRAVETCKLEFVEGELALSRRDLAAARRHFDNCLGTGLTNYIEYYMALVELRRLGSVPSSRRGGKER